MESLQIRSLRLRRSRRPLAALLGLAAVVAACGENAWQNGTGPSFGADAERPRVEIQAPDSGQTFAVGDPLRVEVRVRDNHGVRQLELQAFSLRGSARLGTQVKVARFETKLVDLAAQAPVRDSVVVRDLIATADTVPEDTVYVVAAARDSVGNQRADTTRISLGGSRVRIVAPVPDRQVSAGATLDASVLALDRRNPVRVVRLLLRRAIDAAPFDSLTRALSAPRDSVVSDFAYPVPAAYTGPLYLQAQVLNAANITSVSPMVAVRVNRPSSDSIAPVVRFSLTTPPRAEPWDTVTVNVSATDNGERLSRIGATIVARRAATGDTLTRITRADSSGAASGVFRFVLRDLGMPARVDSTFTLQLEVTAFAVDTAQRRNCATAISPDRGQSLGCVQAASRPAGQTVVLSESAGALQRVLGVRGRTAPHRDAGSRLADLAGDSVNRRVFASNFSKNRVEILPYDAGAFAGSVAVGSEPWGLAVGVGRDTLFVANSGGTNISVVPLTASAPRESRRIFTPDVRLWGVRYDVGKDSVNSVLEFDYSDRPQFIGQVAGGQLMYSTRPTRARADGTVRAIDFARDQTAAFGRVSEILVNYAEESSGEAIVVNALDAGLAANQTLGVCPRRLLASQSDPGCVVSTPTIVADSLAKLRRAGLTDTYVALGYNVRSIGLSDTTFVAVSRDHSTIAFGEGATSPDPGRIFLYQSAGGVLVGSTTETTDLVGNAAERVIGVGLNGDGSFGVARGDRVYFFREDLRLQGYVPSDSPSGGSALHPLNADYPLSDGRQRAFTSGVDAGGRPFIDVVDSYFFNQVRRIFIRDPVVGTLIAMPVGAGDPLAGTAVLRLFGITTAGVLQIDVTQADLQ